MKNSNIDNLTQAQNELYAWIKNYMKEFQHSPSIRQMMNGMGGTKALNQNNPESRESKTRERLRKKLAEKNNN